MKQYPAIDVRTDAADLLLAIVDDFRPSAVEERDRSVRIFFAETRDRDEAMAALLSRFDVAAVDVSDEDWARRSQENLKPITVGRITIAPPWAARSAEAQSSAISHRPLAITHQPSVIEILILPSMGFGTGHHATTRLCLAALQTIDVAGCKVLDVGTGSGVLAIAAARLGAAQAIGIDCDADAIQSARENLDLNPEAPHVAFEMMDLANGTLPPADVVTANLTGALLVRSAPGLLAAVRQGGTLIVSGIQSHERDDVREAFAGAKVWWEQEEDGWVGIAVKKSWHTTRDQLFLSNRV
jgi:ribosomal protein L11 methyltransferase